MLIKTPTSTLNYMIKKLSDKARELGRRLSFIIQRVSEHSVNIHYNYI